MRPTTKLAFRMIIVFCAVIGHWLHAEVQPQIIPEGIGQFRDYIRQTHADMATQRATRALVLSRAFTKKPFHSPQFRPEINELAIKLLDGWQAPQCLKKANVSNSALIIVGESHSSPHCLLIGQAHAREASQNKIVLAMEGVEFGGSITTADLAEDFLVGKAIQTLANTGVAHGIESLSLGGLAIFTTLWGELSHTLLSHPDWSNQSFDYENVVNNIPTDYRRLFFQSNFDILFSQIFSPDDATANALLAGPDKEASLAPALNTLKILRKNALASDPNTLNQYIEKSRTLFTIKEMSLFLRSIALNHYEQNRKNIFEALSISETLATQLDAYIKNTLSGAYDIDFDYLISGTLRNLVFAKNVSELYCNLALPANKSLVVQVGELHANALEYLFEKTTEKLPLQIRREGTASTFTTLGDDLRSLEQFIEQSDLKK